MNGHTKPGAGGPYGKKILNHVTWNGKREAARNHCVDPNHAAVGVGKRPAGIARSQSDIRLHPRLRAEPANRSNRVDHARREGADEAQRIADGDGKFAGRTFDESATEAEGRFVASM